jgi:hypothetical protein
LFIRVTGDAAKSFSECFGVTMFTAWADFGAASQRIPRRVSPFDFGILAHVAPRAFPISIIATAYEKTSAATAS